MPKIIAKRYLFLCSLFFWIVFSCGGDEPMDIPIPDPNPGIPIPDLSDDELLELTQESTFNYFWDYAEPNSGAARERFHPGSSTLDQVVTSGGTGFGLMAILTGIERNFISRQEAVERFEKIFGFLENADRFHGAWPHWMNGETGKVVPFSPQDDGGDLVETAFLCQGLICVKEYFKDGNEREKLLAELADQLWKGVEWDWYTQGQDALYWHWSPNHNFAMNFKLSGYNEVLITYVMAAASPDHTISKKAYTSGWAIDGGIKSDRIAYGQPLLVKHNGAETYGGPLFWAHYSYLGLNPNGLQDEFVNYWDVNVNHSKINYQYCVQNPKNYMDYGKDCWGLTASYSRNPDGSIGYAAHAPGNDLGIISPTAALSSMPYTPAESLRALRYFYSHREKLLGPAGFYDAFKPGSSWVADAYLAIDQGPIIVMIENYRTGLLWNLFMQNEEVQNGLDKLGFSYSN
ncbi:glucoamylase family protein [Lutimonas saemankumensis]|uniref:glucoamylase family protein n=1 Tax=Lutimonas saemankumensis TaxID=483016 RepID=UPI00374367C4